MRANLSIRWTVLYGKETMSRGEREVNLLRSRGDKERCN